MSDNKPKKKLSDILVVVAIFGGIGSFFGIFIGFAIGNFVLSLIMGIILVVCLLYLLIEHLVTKSKEKTMPNIGTASTSNSTSDGPRTTTPPPSRQPTRKVSDEFLLKMDEYIAKEYPNLPLSRIGQLPRGNGDRLDYARQVSSAMQKHLGLKYQIITISLFDSKTDTNKEKQEAGTFQRTGLITADIKIDSSLDLMMFDACLAHEFAHAFQSFNGKQPYEDGSIEEEQFTDLLTFYLGFDRIVKLGYYGYQKKLGYVNDGDFLKIEEIYSKRTSAPDTYAKEKAELAQLADLYERMVVELIDECDQLLNKYLPPEDKTFVLETKKQYSSDEEKTKIKQYKENIERRAKSNVDLDITGLEIRLENLMKSKEKLDRIYNFVFTN